MANGRKYRSAVAQLIADRLAELRISAAQAVREAEVPANTLSYYLKEEVQDKLHRPAPDKVEDISAALKLPVSKVMEAFARHSGITVEPPDGLTPLQRRALRALARLEDAAEQAAWVKALEAYADARATGA
ncbi:hypothetical protein M8C13_06115 [Crossiella sp. SN42]|uniref:hypothetical protein n=1 Tax=Crossiella sp. SN42 TaxID=2944808 RepID=UPI00207CB9B0|nr:hypothetical protein [Crossiella sp. SN42]MCO1575334.1 hypothetical protein [Crossiella sp. SN42]